MTGPAPRRAVRFPVEGMTCQSCVNRISRAVRTIDGVRRVRVDLGRERVTVECDRGRVADAAIVAAVEGAGYHARIHEAMDVLVRPSLLHRLLHH